VAAITEDGAVFAWGTPTMGGAVGAAGSRLISGVQCLRGNLGAFAAVTATGAVVT